MTLIPAIDLLHAALMGGYAVGYFESWNLESLQGVIDAAEQTHSPIMIGFNGGFLSQRDRITEERVALYGALGKAAAASACVPCSFIFNECANDNMLHQAIDDGFNIVMLADPEASLENYQQRVSALVRMAHAKGVAVEAEIGELPDGSNGRINNQHSSLTEPRLAARFVSETGIDLLSVSIGNVHILVNGQQTLNLEHLEKIRKAVNIPFGLHGGSGIETTSLKAAIQSGVVKVNYGTYIKQRYLKALRKMLDTTEQNPHALLGMGGDKDVLVAGRLAVCEAILERIEILGCCGKA